MAGGVTTCQITRTPLCGINAMAIVVRQSIYSWNEWKPITIPSYGRGNDDFLALDCLLNSNIQDSFAEKHGYATMADFLDEAFIINNTIPKTIVGENDEQLRNIPFGIVYINDDIWKELRQQAAGILQSETKIWDSHYLTFQNDISIDQPVLIKTWVDNFIKCVQDQTKIDELMSKGGHGFKKNEFDNSRETWSRHDK